MVKLQQLKILCALEQYRSFSQTAQQLYLSQPALSVAIKNLERELGGTLLHRSNKGIQLTPFGKATVEKAQEILEEIAKIREIVAEQVPNDHITIGTNTQAGSDILFKIFMWLSKQYPQLVIDIRNLDQAELLHQLLYRSLDFALYQINAVAPEKEIDELLQKYNLRFLEVRRDALVAIMRREHPLAQKDIVSIQTLFSYPFVSAHVETEEGLLAAFMERGYSAEPIVVDDVFCLNQLIAQTNAWALIPQSEVTRYQQTDAGGTMFAFCQPYDFFSYGVLGWLQSGRYNEPRTTEEMMLLQALQAIQL